MKTYKEFKSLVSEVSDTNDFPKAYDKLAKLEAKRKNANFLSKEWKSITKQIFSDEKLIKHLDNIDYKKFFIRKKAGEFK